MKHKHAELIKAWADGAEIEYWTGVRWLKSDSPSWLEEMQYRIKPEPKADVDVFIVFDGIWARDCVINPINVYDWTNKVKLTFDGETAKLIKAEVL